MSDGTTKTNVTCTDYEKQNCMDSTGAAISFSQVSNWGVPTCRTSSSGGGIFHAIGSFIRSVVAGF
jgi:hypothetical protein